MKLLIVEDEKGLSASIVKFLAKDNYAIDVAYNFEDAEYLINTIEYECALIDLMLPDGSGFDLVKLLKNQQPSCGIIILTAKDTLDDKLQGLNFGADDYITKPFHLAELNARLKSLIRRMYFNGKNEIYINEISIIPGKREVRVNDQIVHLTKREYDILMFLISNTERVLTKETIVEHIWGDDSNTFDNFDFVYTHIKNLRKKLIDSGANDYIKSIYGIGYIFTTK